MPVNYTLSKEIQERLIKSKYNVEKKYDSQKGKSDDLSALIFDDKAGIYKIIEPVKEAIHALGSDINAKFYTGMNEERLIYWYTIENGRRVRHANKKSKKLSETLLTLAVKNNQLPLVIHLIESKASLEGTDEAGNTALHIAAAQGNFELCKLLIKAGANINAKNHKLETPLHLALRFKPDSHTKRERQEQIALLLLDNNADANAATRAGHTPLHLAATINNPVIIRKLFEKNANANAKNKQFKKTPFHRILQKGSPDMIELFIKNGADINAKTITDKTALHFAVLSGRIENVSRLLKQKTDLINSKAQSWSVGSGPIYPMRAPIDLALKHWDVEMLEYLARSGADLRSLNDPFNPSRLSKLHHLDPARTPIPFKLIKWLLEHNVKLGPKNTYNKQIYETIASQIPFEASLINAMIAQKLDPPLSLLSIAIERNNMELLELIFKRTLVKEWLKKDTNLYLFINQFFSFALKKGSKEMIEYLYSQIEQQQIPYLIAAAAVNGNLDVITWLNAKPNAALDPPRVSGTNLPYSSALYMAALNGKFEVIDYLILNGAKLDGVASWNGESVLHAAVRKDKETTEYIYNALLKARKTPREIFLSLADSDGNTPLHTAALAGKDDVVSFLVEKGADVNAVNTAGKNLLYLYLEKGSLDMRMIEYLISHSSNPQELMDHADANGLRPIDIAIKTNNVAAIKTLGSLGASGFPSTRALADKVVSEAAEAARKLEGKEKTESLKKSDAAELYIGATHVYNAWDPANYAQYKDEVEKNILLLGTGLNFKFNEGQTILHAAVLGNSKELIQKILDHALIVEPPKGKHIINSEDSNGNTPLHFAALNNKEGLVLLFLNKFADINKQNKAGNTALHVAILNNKVDTVFEFLNYLERNPQPHLFEIVNKDRHTVFDVARERAKTNPENVFIYVMMLIHKLQNLSIPDLSDEVAINNYIKEKKDILNSLREQFAIMAENNKTSERNSALFTVAKMLSDETKPSFDPSVAYEFFDAITEDIDDPETFQNAQKNAISLLMAQAKFLKFAKSESFPSIVLSSEEKEEIESQSKSEALSLDEDEIEETKESLDETQDVDKKSQADLQMEVFFKHYFQLNKENREDIPFSRFFGSYAFNEKLQISKRGGMMSVEEKEQKEVKALAEGFVDTSHDSVLTLMRLVKKLSQKTAEQSQVRSDERKQMQDLIAERDAALQKAARLERNLTTKQSEVKQLRELLGSKEAKRKETSGPQAITYTAPTKSSPAGGVKKKTHPISPKKPRKG